MPPVQQLTTPTPIINPAITKLFSLSSSYLKSEQNYKFILTICVIIVIAAVTIGLLIWYGKQRRLFETPENIKRISQQSTQSQIIYAQQNTQRKGIRSYINSLIASGISASQLCLTNFYISTVVATGVFFPVVNGVISTEAVRAAVLGGARAFVLDIWPDLDPGANFAPVIQVVESGTNWRRISLNKLPLVSILKALAQEAFEIPDRPGYEDPLFIYLRFNGNPRPATFNATADALQIALESYRLDANFNNCRAQDRLFSTPITFFYKRALFFSNHRAQGTRLADYINVGPKDGIKMDWGINDALGLSREMKTDAEIKIKTNLSWVAPHSESADAEKNSFNWSAAHNIGIHFVALNFWNHNDNLKKYLAPTLFGIHSFSFKPTNLRYTIETIPNPQLPQNPQWGSGNNAGVLRDPPPIARP